MAASYSSSMQETSLLSHVELSQTLCHQIDEGQLDKARSSLEGLMDPDVADVLIVLPESFEEKAFRLLSNERAARVATYLPQEMRERLWPRMSDQELAGFISALQPDDRRFVLDAVDAERAPRLLSLITPQERKETQVLFSYPEESVGRLMTPNYIRVRPEWTAQRVLDHIRQYGPTSETLETLYVIDKDGRLIDDIKLRDVLLLDPKASVKDIMDNEFICVNASKDQEETVRVMERYDIFVLPVVDESQKLVGIVTFDDVLDVAEVEASEDIEKLGAVEALGDRYSSVSLLRLFRKRVTWLVALFGGGLMTVIAMGSFQEKIEQQAILALFVPLIIASGGNTGTQTASLMIRALALGDVSLSDWWRVMKREIASGLLLASVLGSLGLITGLVAAHFFATGGIAAENPSIIGVAIGIAVGAVVVCGALVGSMLPFLFGRMGVDPATSSTPAVATILDVTGLVVYFLVASLVIGI